MRPIQKGCMAVVYGMVPENQGKIVEVGNFVGKLPPTPSEELGGLIIRSEMKDWWEVDKSITIINEYGSVILRAKYAREPMLHRLDDGDSEECQSKRNVLEETEWTL